MLIKKKINEHVYPLVDLGRGLKLKNPVMLASGTASFGEELGRMIPLNKLGGIVTKAISIEPREGNQPPRMAETASGMLNAIGLANVGVEAFLRDKIPYLATIGTTVVLNVVGKSIDDYVEVVSRVQDGTDIISGYEINLSCPNVKGECIIFGTSAKATYDIVSTLRRKTEHHLMVKLSPNVTSIAEIARAAEEAGADSLSLINTVVGMAVDYKTRKPKLKNITGGLSGPAIKPIALAKVWETYQAVKIPIVGMGGIATFEDAMEFFVVGARAVQIGTQNFVNPAASVSIAQAIETYFAEATYSFDDYVGSLFV